MGAGHLRPDLEKLYFRGYAFWQIIALEPQTTFTYERFLMPNLVIVPQLIQSESVHEPTS